MKNKKLIITAVAAVLLIAAGVGAYFIFSAKSVEGEWEMVVNPEISQATPDEAQPSKKVYYTFGKPGEYGDGTYKTFFDGGVEEGKYKLSEKDGKKLINLGTQDLEYSISGARLFGGARLTIVFPEQTNEQTGEKTPAQDYVFAQAKAPDYEHETYPSRQTDKKLSGEWVTDERKLEYYTRQLSYTETVKFGDGIMSIHYVSSDLALDRYMYYSYTASNGKLEFSLVTDKDNKFSVSYTFDKDGNLKFTDDKTSSSIFADAFFSDVTYSPVSNDSGSGK